MKRYKSIAGLVRNLGAEVKYQQEVIKALRRPPTTTEQQVLLKYVETCSTPKTAKFMREQGVKGKAGKAFSTYDVSELIRGGHAGLSPQLLKFAREIFKRNSRFARRHLG